MKADKLYHVFDYKHEDWQSDIVQKVRRYIMALKREFGDIRDNVQKQNFLNLVHQSLLDIGIKPLWRDQDENGWGVHIISLEIVDEKLLTLFLLKQQ